MTVSGLTTCSAGRQPRQTRENHAHRMRSAVVNWRRGRRDRWTTRSWCRSATAFEVQRLAPPDEKPQRAEQRSEDGDHAASLSENANNLKRRNKYGVSGRDNLIHRFDPSAYHASGPRNPGGAEGSSTGSRASRSSATNACRASTLIEPGAINDASTRVCVTKAILEASQRRARSLGFGSAASGSST